MTRPRQRERLFDSEAEKQAEIAQYKERDAKLQKEEAELRGQLYNLQMTREQITRRIQELQNLKLEL